MSLGGWPLLRPGRLGAGVVLEGQVVWSLRVGSDPDHERVNQRVVGLVENGLPLVASYLSLSEVASRLYAEHGSGAAREFVDEVREVLNVVLPTGEDVLAAEGVLSQGVERLTLEQAVAGAIAKRLGCSVYGFSPAYHLFHVAVVMD